MILIASSCSTVTQEIQVGKNYKMDVWIKTKEVDKYGMAVLPKKPEQKITIEAWGKLTLFVFRTCSREIAIENARTGFDKYEALITYKLNEVEASGACPAEISAYNDKGRHSFGFIDFEDESTTLPATVICGGTTTDFGGVSVCQERQGLIQKIKFPTTVVVSPDPGCAIGKIEGSEFEFPINAGHCTYAFMERQKPYRFHRANFYGFSEILIRQ